MFELEHIHIWDSSAVLWEHILPFFVLWYRTAAVSESEEVSGGE